MLRKKIIIMNKTVTVILIILLSILTIAVTGMFILLIKGNINFNWSFNFGGYSNKLIDSKEIETIKDINIDCDIADVFVEESSDNTIKIELYSEDSDNYYIKEEDNTINVKLYPKKKGFQLFGKIEKIIIKIPKDYNKNLKVNFTTGDFKIESFPNMRLDFKGSTGDIKADKLKHISGEISTGDITIGSVDVFSAATDTGDIKIDSINKRVYAKTSTGDIKIGEVTVEEDSTIKTSAGDVKIDSLKGAFIESHTNTGDIRVNNNDRKLDNTITINTSTGDITVNQ